MKASPQLHANAIALGTALLWVVCSVGVYLFPGLSYTLMSWWLHTSEPLVAGRTVTFSSFLFGGLTFIAAAWLIGWLYGWAYTVLAKKAKA